MLKKRIITGVIMALVILLGIWFCNPLQFALASALILALAAWEWAGLCQLTSNKQRTAYVFVMLLVMALSSAVLSIILLTAALLMLLWLAEEVYCYAKAKPVAFLIKPIYKQVVGVCLFVFCWTGLNAMYAQTDGRQWVIYAIALIACMDTAGYFVGKKWGKRILCKRVSPNKTWEGLWGGLVGLLPLSLLASWVLHLSGLNILWLFLGSLVVGVFALYGDLIESLIKRDAGAKDSGSLLPGHGGVLDRIDGWLAAMPVIALLAFFL